MLVRIYGMLIGCHEFIFLYQYCVAYGLSCVYLNKGVDRYVQTRHPNWLED